MSEKIITADQLSEILKKYSLGELASSLDQITNGWTNVTIKFRTKPNDQIFIVRQYVPGNLRNISRENVEFELNFIAYLANELNLPVVPVLNPPGILTINNDVYVALFPFVEGVKYLNTSSNPSRELWQILEISYFLGRMHSNLTTKKYEILQTNRCSVNYVAVKYELVNSCENFAIDYPDLYQRIMRMIDNHTQVIPLISGKNEQEQFQRQLEKNLPTGYIHADIHDDNVLFHPNQKKLVAVLDFDDMYIGPLLIDLAMTLSLWCSVGSEFKMDYAKQFLLNYQQERGMSLTIDEWNLLELYCYLTILNQILFTIEAEKDSKSTRDMINELLAPIEDIDKEKDFIEKLR